MKNDSRADQLIKPLAVHTDKPISSTALEINAPALSLLTSAWNAYVIDSLQRSLLFADVLRQRGDQMLAHEAEDMPPQLDFEYEMVLDARQFEKPANYALVRITSATCGQGIACVDETNRPIIIVDPRAGHGPGIGGFKRDSEVGMALHRGHPTYFVMFFPEPCPHQTLADVHHALRRFVAMVQEKHPGSKPALYGNCQAGWAVTLLSADCEGTVGPVILNGSPLSYWAGDSGVNPMRLLGGLTGGAWLVHWLADINNGKLDGAWLVQNFEVLNPAQSHWNKYYHLFSNIDVEQERFLGFERWWSGFYRLTKEEISSIVENLFIGNALERGKMPICDHCSADLHRIKNPILVFASSADNITPPHQALGWVAAVYKTTAALKKAGQRIVYLLNQNVGHLGIFVASDVAKLEHRAILDSLNSLENLAPGLYEMKIAEPTGAADCRDPQYSVSFEPRQVEDISYSYDRRAFEQVQRLSEQNVRAYEMFAGPWVRASTLTGASLLGKWLHPMRLQRKAMASMNNPFSPAIAFAAETVRSQRQPTSPDNPFVVIEHVVADGITSYMEQLRNQRDAINEWLFNVMYR